MTLWDSVRFLGLVCARKQGLWSGLKSGVPKHSCLEIVRHYLLYVGSCASVMVMGNLLGLETTARLREWNRQLGTTVRRESVRGKEN